MAPHKFSFALDSLHSRAYFWSCEDSLWRRHPESHIASFVFQDLQSQRDNIVSTIITRAIRIHLYKDIPKSEKDVFSSKSLLIISLAKMASHRGVKSFESHAR